MRALPSTPATFRWEFDAEQYEANRWATMRHLAMAMAGAVLEPRGIERERDRACTCVVCKRDPTLAKRLSYGRESLPEPTASRARHTEFVLRVLTAYLSS